MRNPERIKPFLKEIENIWDELPDWRFGQLIENFKRVANIPDLFYIEDDRFIEIFKEAFTIKK